MDLERWKKGRESYGTVAVIVIASMTVVPCGMHADVLGLCAGTDPVARSASVLNEQSPRQTFPPASGQAPGPV